MNRKELIDKIAEEQQKIVDNLKVSVDRYKNASDIDEDNTLDPDDFSRQTEAKEMQLHFEKLWTDAQAVHAFILSEKEQEHPDIEVGSMIETDKAYMFVGASLPVFHLNEKSVLCFSDDAPIFTQLKNKSVGDTLMVGSQEHKILSRF